MGKGRFGRASQEFAMSENEPKKLRLFVVGESSGDPDEWMAYGERAIVVAHDEEEARSLVDFSNRVTEIPFTKPVKLMSEHSPHRL
jgi:hypothetical protein